MKIEDTEIGSVYLLSAPNGTEFYGRIKWRTPGSSDGLSIKLDRFAAEMVIPLDDNFMSTGDVRVMDTHFFTAEEKQRP